MKLLIAFLALTLVSSQTDLFTKFYDKAAELTQKMTLEEKIGQMTQCDIGAITTEEGTDFSLIKKWNLGSLLIGGNGAPDDKGNLQVGELDYHYATEENWKKLTHNMMSQPISIGDQDIYLLLGTDAVHGNQHTIGATLWPHNIGLGATHNPENFKNAGYWTTKSVLESGFNYIFAPTVAVSHNPQWGRHYETMGDLTNVQLIWEYGRQFVEAAQIVQDGYITGTLTSTKHFLGDGATYEGHDEGNDRVYNFTSFYESNIQGYRGAIKADTGTVMSSYSAVNDNPMVINGKALNGFLKEKEGFTGFIISDYDEIAKLNQQGLPTTFLKMSRYDAVCLTMNAGVDMMMIPNKVEEYQSNLKKCVESGDLHISRIDDAVKKILATKMAMKLVQNKASSSTPLPTSEHIPTKDSTEYEDALKAAQESLVLLQNNNKHLPVDASKIEYVLFIGERIVDVHTSKGDVPTLYQDYDNIGQQNGGWTVGWQGFEGNDFFSGDLKVSSNATSLLDAAKTHFPKAQMLHPVYSSTTDKVQIAKDRETFKQQLSSL